MVLEGIIGSGHIGFAVSIEVADRKIFGLQANGIFYRRLKGAVPVANKNH